MEPAASTSARPPRRRGRGRRGNGGNANSGGGANSTAAAENGNASRDGPAPAAGSSVAGTSAPAPAPANASANGGGDANASTTPRRRGARKNRRGRGSGAGEGSAGRPARGKRETGPRAEIKVVVRRLPPRMTREEFLEAAGPLGASCSLWMSFHGGSVKGVGPGTTSAAAAVGRRTGLARHSTAHLGFSARSEAAALFTALNGRRFVDPKSGTEYIARVERALFQSVPRGSPPAKKAQVADAANADTAKTDDANTNAMPGNAHYARFLERLQAERDGVPLDDAVAPAPGKTSVLVMRSRPRGIGNGPAAQEAVQLTRLMEDVRSRRRERDERKGPRAAKGRRRGRRGEKAAMSEKPAKREGAAERKGKKAPRAGRAAKRAAAASAAAGASGGAGGGAAGPKGAAEGDGVYVVRGPRAKKGAAKAAAAKASGETGGAEVPTPKRKGKAPRAAAPAFPAPAGAPAIRLLRKEAPMVAQGNGGQANGT